MMFMFKNILAIAIGASIGATLRWFVSMALNNIFPIIPLGTLTVNLVGGYCVGLALSFFAFFPEVAPHWRLLIITGFLGALTTFSAFSAEVSVLIQEARYFWAALTIGLHVVGSLIMTFLGIMTFGLIRRLYF